MGWEIYPSGLYEILARLAREYKPIPIMITENGAACRDVVAPDGAIRDRDRLDYIREHLIQAHRAIGDGVNLQGNFCWSFMDNFEWSLGYTKRFGLFYTDYRAQARLWKDSAEWYRGVIRENAVISEG